ncbi:MAG: hypothetical protein IJ168_00210 [Eubacterium sp.]|nr:hypothetical protein [Eubacterium sp.]
MKKPKIYKVKRFREIRHIADKIYVDKKITNITGIYPDVKKSKRHSLYGVAVRNTVKQLLWRIILWAAVVAVFAFLARATYGIMPIVAITGVAASSVAAVVAILTYAVTFRYDVLSQVLSLDGTKLVQAINEIAGKITVSKYRDNNKDNYQKLDALSQIVDTELVRRRKIDLLLSFTDDFGFDWEFETDTVLLNSDSKLTLQYLDKVKSIDESKLGPASLIYMQEKRKGRR